MAQYRKKPVVVEAIQLSADNVEEVIAFCGDKIKSHPLTGVVIETLEGNMIASEGDYIIKGVKGEFYPCKPDIFEATYEYLNSNYEAVSLYLITNFENQEFFISALSMNEAMATYGNNDIKKIEWLAISKQKMLQKQAFDLNNFGEQYIPKISPDAITF